MYRACVNPGEPMIVLHRLYRRGRDDEEERRGRRRGGVEEEGEGGEEGRAAATWGCKEGRPRAREGRRPSKGESAGEGGSSSSSRVESYCEGPRVLFRVLFRPPSWRASSTPASARDDIRLSRGPAPPSPLSLRRRVFLLSLTVSFAYLRKGSIGI